MRRQRKILEHEARIRLFGEQLVNDRLRVFAMRTLQIAELDNRDRGLVRTTRRPVDSFQQSLLRRLIRLGPEGQDVTRQCVLAVRCNVKGRAALSLGIAQNNIHLGQTCRNRRLNRRDFPGDRRVIAKRLLQKRIHGFF